VAVTVVCGFEIGSLVADASVISMNGTASSSTVQARSGSRSLRINPASGTFGYVNMAAVRGWAHFGLYIATMPTVTRLIVGTAFGSTLKLNASGTLEFFDSTTTRGASGVLNTNQWYWIGYRTTAGTSVDLLQVDGVTVVTGTVIDGDARLGCSLSEATAIDVYLDDYIVDNAGFLSSSKVGLLVPTADSAVGTGWTLGSGGTTGLWDAVNNLPPTAVADTGTTAQIRNATSNANVNYDATMTTYSVAGIGAGDTVLAVQPVISTAAPVVTSAKAGTIGVVSNPTIANIALGAGGTAGAFWSGVAGGTWPTGWKTSLGTVTASPSVTLGTAPVMRVTQVTASTRIAMVAFMGIYVAWTPSVVVTRVPRHGFVNHQNPGVL
jgi:hypothetical protein